MTKIWVALEYDYSNCWYEGDIPEIVVLGASQGPEACKELYPKADDIQEVELT